MKKIITSILAIASLFSGKSMAMENTDQIVSIQEVEIIENEKKYQNYVVSENDEENLIKELTSELTKSFSNIKADKNSFGIEYRNLVLTVVSFYKVKEKCKTRTEVKKYLLRKLFDLACFYYDSRPDMMASHATEEDYRNYHIVKKWTDERNLDNIFNKILSRIDAENLEFDDLTQTCKSIFRLILIN